MADETGIETLRKLVNMAGWSRESALDGFDVHQTVNILLACYRCEIEVLPDQLTDAEKVGAALSGELSDACRERLRNTP